MRKYLLPIIAGAMAIGSTSAFALQASDNFQARITIQTSCIVTADDLDFGNVGVIVGGEAASANVDVNCSAGTAYTLSFDSASIVTSYNSSMVNGGSSVDYSAAISGGGGTGPATFTINGVLPNQVTPAAGIYTDNQTVYVNY
ncbi:MAG: spore coat protein U domain-containing protein [Alphaproteobacteria bacterium]|nr:spore coat protein U domain-containing protein [Alphaproteobacteria bacterium]